MFYTLAAFLSFRVNSVDIEVEIRRTIRNLETLSEDENMKLKFVSLGLSLLRSPMCIPILPLFGP